MIRLNILFLRVFFAIVSASKIGTPALFNEDNVLEKLAKQDFVTKSFVIGNWSNVLSYHQMKDDLVDKYLENK